jgi:hypothetical protein
MGRARDISKVFSTNTALATDSEISAFNYLTQASASTTYQTKSANGSILVSTQNFSSVGSANINNVFTSTYRHYRVILQLTAATADANINMKMRQNGVDTSTNYYFGGAYGIFTGTNSNWSGNNTTQWSLGSIDTSNQNISQSYSMDIYSPQVTRDTNISLQGWSQEQGGNTYWLSFSGTQNTGTQFDGFSIIASAGNISGKTSIYGYNE